MRNRLLPLRITHHALRITRSLIMDCYEINYKALVENYVEAIYLNNLSESIISFSSISGNI